jgi:hypothetical protein
VVICEILAVGVGIQPVCVITDDAEEKGMAVERGSVATVICCSCFVFVGLGFPPRCVVAIALVAVCAAIGCGVGVGVASGNSDLWPVICAVVACVDVFGDVTVRLGGIVCVPR